jgi:hypothetical protein
VLHLDVDADDKILQRLVEHALEVFGPPVVAHQDGERQVDHLHDASEL